MRQTIPVTITGKEYTYPLTITELTGKDISLSTVALSMGSYDLPASWDTPVETTSLDTAARIVQLLIDTSTAVGTYWLWSKVGDNSEVIIRRHDRIDIT